MMVDGAHVRPEPIEAPEPRAIRMRDLVRARAVIHGHNTLQARVGQVDFEAFREALQAVEDYVSCHDRRRS